MPDLPAANAPLPGFGAPPKAPTGPRAQQKNPRPLNNAELTQRGLERGLQIYFKWVKKLAGTGVKKRRRGRGRRPKKSEKTEEQEVEKKDGGGPQDTTMKDN
ncbi:MAG: hypothetical protein M1812_002410 [Candelaria pacifica]|nr:MAG: hypothetical protein M1812_002410 [Candelaria pacifica]